MRVGILGGTFDPIHYGHLRLAEEARERLSLERVLFIPNQVSPFKDADEVSPGALRLEMVRLATAGNGAFTASGVELERPGPSYTVETLRRLRAERPGDELFFLTGTDLLGGLTGWREPEAVLELARFVTLTRPGAGDDFARALEALPEAWRPKIRYLESPGLEISSTHLRDLARGRHSLRYLAPDPVVDFVEARGLYRTGNGGAMGV
ncbi:MAG TPA: nicotinate-nucleotide adenylyltransferase [Armatimonadaceae bacterium]|jgi:nicotinate-nucleotide adenylyltransferase|nr:nicotinate-nucleotide adenylyltransferase [Armatimonadaceae bacterium]